MLWGARGTGKSSLIRALLAEYAGEGLRLIEIERDDLADLPRAVEQLAGQPQRFVVFCDDLSFDSGSDDYRVLKSVLDGSLEQAPDNVVLYATSNRRHLVAERQSDNANWEHVDGELHPSEAAEDKIALSDRFGLWLSFYPFTQDHYLAVVRHWCATLAGKVRPAAGVVRRSRSRGHPLGFRSRQPQWPLCLSIRPAMGRAQTVGESMTVELTGVGAGLEGYAMLAAQVEALLSGERNLVANAAQLSAFIYQEVPDLNWAGFYFVEGEDQLLLGPFQGKVACMRIPFSKGVCGAAARERRTQRVEDVHAFPGHIACDAASRSELVVPLVQGGRLIGVLDLDSPHPGRFSAADQAGIEALVAAFLVATDC